MRSVVQRGGGRGGYHKLSKNIEYFFWNRGSLKKGIKGIINNNKDKRHVLKSQQKTPPSRHPSAESAFSAKQQKHSSTRHVKFQVHAQAWLGEGRPGVRHRIARDTMPGGVSRGWGRAPPGRAQPRATSGLIRNRLVRRDWWQCRTATPP